MPRKPEISCLIFFSAVIWLSANNSQATPDFARKHRLSCSMCHGPFPRLNAYGKNFAKNAFSPKADEQGKLKKFKDVGDDNLFLLNTFPLSLRTEMFFDVTSDGDDEDVSDSFRIPWLIKLLSGGNIAPNIGYYVSLLVGQTGQNAGIEQAVVKFKNLFGSRVDLILGRFQIPTGIFRHNLRPTFQDYMIYKLTPGQSTTSLSYDSGLAIQTEFDMGLQLTATISNGGKSATDHFAENFDADKFKHFSLRVSQILGPIKLGLFAYYGKENLTRNSDGQEWNNELNSWGSDISLSLGKAEMNLQYIQRRDIKPTYTTIRDNSPLFTQGLIAQAIANVLSEPAQMQIVLLFNYVDSDDPKIRQEAYSVNLSYLLLTNLKIMAEYTFARVRDGQEVNEHRATVGITAGI